jgi:mono/diheme cytochrome c family protein
MGLGMAMGTIGGRAVMESRVRYVFSALSLIVLALLVVAFWKASRPSWGQYQTQFYRLEAEQEPNAAAKNAMLATPRTIKQILLPGLQRVDRCTTCHLGVEDPTLKNAPEPFRYHSGLGPHRPSKFGCTICHGGQGLATDNISAHGKVEHWSQPLLPKEYIRASCGRCHKEGEVPGVPELTEGRHILETHGCRGCHKLNGVGGSIGPDLTEEGAKNRSPEWLARHFIQPNSVSPNSPMPNFHFTGEQARALTFYMLSLTSEQMGAYYASVPLIPSASQGRKLFVQESCIVCHQVGGVGGKGGPDLLGVTTRHSLSWLDEKLLNPELGAPGTTMPAYDLEPGARKAILAFLASATAEDARLILAGRPKTAPVQTAMVESGRQIFVRFGCVGCHGMQAQGGVPNPNSQGGEVPSLVHVAEDYTKPEVEHIIRDGKTPPVADSSKPVPPLYMPAWKNALANEDINRVVAYLWSLRPKETTAW